MAGNGADMIDLWVELSGENLPLARAELRGAVEALRGESASDAPAPSEQEGQMVRLPGLESIQALASRLALAHRCVILLPLGSYEEAGRWLRQEAASHPSAAFRPLAHPRGDATDAGLETLVGAWKSGGGTVSLRAPARRFCYGSGRSGAPWFGEEVAVVERKAFNTRRMPTLPFRRPVSLSPRLARVAANLGRIRPGDRIVDPFVGTGALLAEAHLIGARVSGADRDPEMIRGTAANLEHLGATAELLRAVDAGAPFPAPDGGLWDGLLTDPPYGRSSGTLGEPPEELLHRAVDAWGPYVKSDGYLSLIVPDSMRRDLGASWVLLDAVPDRLHRSLTREFRAYRRVGTVRPGPERPSIFARPASR